MGLLRQMRQNRNTTRSSRSKKNRTTIEDEMSAIKKETIVKKEPGTWGISKWGTKSNDKWTKNNKYGAWPTYKKTGQKPLWPVVHKKRDIEVIDVDAEEDNKKSGEVKKESGEVKKESDEVKKEYEEEIFFKGEKLEENGEDW